MSRYKKNAGCRVDANDEGASRGPKKKKKTTKKSSAKQIPSPEDEEEESYTQRKSPALSMWYLPVIDRLCALCLSTIYAYSLLCMCFDLTKFSFKFKFKLKIQFEKTFLNLKIINRGGQIGTTTSVKRFKETGTLGKPPRLIPLTEAVAIKGPPK
jgi:hypothetical protein